MLNRCTRVDPVVLQLNLILADFIVLEVGHIRVQAYHCVDIYLGFNGGRETGGVKVLGEYGHSYLDAAHYLIGHRLVIAFPPL